jgi:hypothetical protein
MKKLILGLLCIGSILALPGCWCCRRTCEEPCEEYYDDCYDYDDCYNDDDYCDDGHHHHGKELAGYDGYEEQQGYRRYYRKGRHEEAAPAHADGYVEQQGYRRPYSKEQAPVAPRKATYHKPIHPAVIEACEAKGQKVRYLDKKYEQQNAEMHREAKQAAKMEPKAEAAKVARPSKGTMSTMTESGAAE